MRRHRVQPVIALGAVAESHLELAAARPRAGRAGADAVGAANAAPCPWPTGRAPAATALVGMGEQAVAGPGRCALRGQVAGRHADAQVALGWRLGMQRGLTQAIGKSAWVGAAQALVDSTTISTNRYRTRRMTDSAADRSAARPRATSVAAGRPSRLAARTT